MDEAKLYFNMVPNKTIVCKGKKNVVIRAKKTIKNYRVTYILAI